MKLFHFIRLMFFYVYVYFGFEQHRDIIMTVFQKQFDIPFKHDDIKSVHYYFDVMASSSRPNWRALGIQITEYMINIALPP